MTTVTAAHTYLVLWRTARAMEASALASIADTGLCASDFGVLEALLHKGPTPVNQLGRQVLLTSGSMTAAVDRLADRGLVVRVADPDDRRVRVVALTSEGRRVIRTAFSRHAADLEALVSVLTQPERKTLVDLLARLRKRAGGIGSGLASGRP
jgi:MarR family 2-MHQ and catechol resistance regulon transcriptional repressor